MKKIYAIRMTVSSGAKASRLTVHIANEDLKAGIDEAIARGMKHQNSAAVKNLAKAIGCSGILEGKEDSWHQDNFYQEGHVEETSGHASIDIFRNIELA